MTELMSRKKNLMVAKMPTPVRRSIFEPAPILESEDSKAYDDLHERISSIVNPSDIIEDIWNRELVDLIWEIRRLQEYRTLVLKAAIPKALAETLAPFVDGPWKYGTMDVYDPHGALKPTPSMEMANDWVCGKTEGIKAVNDVLSQGNSTMKDVEAHAMTLAFPKYDQLDELIARMEDRRDGLLAQIERRQAAAAERRRRAAYEAENAEFEKFNKQPATNQNGHSHDERPED